MQKRIKAVILTEAGKNIGLGHLCRCLALYDALKYVGVQPKIILNGEKHLRKFVGNRNIHIYNWLENRKLLGKTLKCADIAIIDSYLAGKEIYDEVSRIVKVPVYLDDMERIKYPAGIIINSAITAPELYCRRDKNNTYLLGGKYVLLRKEFWNLPFKKINRHCRNIFISVGGTDTQNMLPRLTGFINVKFPALTKYITIGESFQSKTNIRQIEDKKTRLVFSADAKEMLRIMLKCDIAISAGGQTLFELAAVGLPTVVLSIASNQNNNIKGFISRGSIEYIGKFDSKSLFTRLENKLNELQDYYYRFSKFNKNRKLVNNQGALTAAKAILQKGVSQNER